MSLRLEWVLECGRCKKTSREPAEALDLICDSDPVRVKQPKASGWETDGIGGWLCEACFKKWKGEG